MVPATIMQPLMGTHNSGFLASSLKTLTFWVLVCVSLESPCLPLDQERIMGQPGDQGIRALPFPRRLNGKLYRVVVRGVHYRASCLES